MTTLIIQASDRLTENDLKPIVCKILSLSHVNSLNWSKQSLAQNGRYLSTKTMTHETLEYLSFIASLAQEGHLNAVIDRCYPLAETADAYRHVEAGRKSGNIVIIVTSQTDNRND